MKTTAGLAIVLVTAPGAKAALLIVNKALKAGLIACGNLVPAVESHYRWKGKIEKATEVLLILKTDRRQIKALEKLVLANHPYDTPEFVVMGVTGGNERYLEWWNGSLGRQS